MVTFIKKILGISILILLSVGTNVYAAQSKASKIIHKAYKYLGSKNSYSFDAVVSDDLSATGPIARLHKEQFTVKVDRPNQFRIDITSDKRHRISYLSDGIYTIYDHGTGYYGQVETAAGIDQSLDILDEYYGIKYMLSALLYSDMNKRTKTSGGKYFGTTDVDGVLCDYIAFNTGDSIVHLWVQSGEKPLIKSYRVIDTTSKEIPESGGSLHWNTNVKSVQSEFVFTIPKDAEQITISPIK